MLARTPRFLKRAGRLARLKLAVFYGAFKAHLVAVALVIDFDFEILRERVDDRRAHAVQPARVTVRFVVELAARVQSRKDDLNARNAEFFVYTHGNSAAVVLDGYGMIAVQRNVYLVCKTVRCLVNGVVDDLPKHMVQSPRPRGTDIHSGPEAHGFKLFKQF
ncbi:hypothetical protein SDC9_154207 [bioreactor metagenome]|uniref:Uncharacterized protein n=1 Tax=bioreactor metagenome TaxID=1076179 RepID=A0A645EZN2_9ZZZZ